MSFHFISLGVGISGSQKLDAMSLKVVRGEGFCEACSGDVGCVVQGFKNKF